MKQLAYPDPQEAQPCDLNKIVNITQVLVNLIVNAGHAIADSGKFEDPAKGLIKVRTEVTEDNVKIYLDDNGCGIPEAVKSRIFDPYFTTKQVGRGSGQGLAISRAIVVDRHQGRFQVESLEGHGTTFIVTLPTLAT